jgi:hypothetical protein
MPVLAPESGIRDYCQAIWADTWLLRATHRIRRCEARSSFEDLTIHHIPAYETHLCQWVLLYQRSTRPFPIRTFSDLKNKPTTIDKWKVHLRLLLASWKGLFHLRNELIQLKLHFPSLDDIVDLN